MMSRAVRDRLEDSPAAEAGGQPVRRVLIMRSCRASEFAAAVRTARVRHPHAEISALTHHGHRDALLQAGVERIIEIPGRRFGLLRMAPWTLRRLRTERFDEIVIPQMSPHADVHVNLYQIACAIRAQAVTILAGEAEQRFEYRAFVRHAFQQTFSGLLATMDVPLFLALLAFAALKRRPRTSPSPNRRRRVLHVI